MPDAILNIFSGQGFPERWKCGPAWKLEPWWGWMHIVSDIAIGMAYFAIPLLLILFAKTKKDIPFPKLLALFAAFILACGATHFMDASIFYWPAYRLAAVLKGATAIISVATVFVLSDVIPAALTLRGPAEAEREFEAKTAELRELTKRLEAEVQARKLAVEELNERREMVQLAMLTGDVGFFSWNLRSNRVAYDAGEIRLTGLGLATGSVDPEEFMCRIPTEYREDVRTRIREAVEQRKPYNAKFPFLRPDGKSIWMSGHGCALVGEDGEVRSIVGLNQDITDQVSREQALNATAEEATSASEQKSRFIAQVSHEIRTPLAAMLGGIDSIIISPPTSETREALRVVRSQGELLQVLINDVLDLSKIEAGKMEFQQNTIPVANLLANICSLMDPLAQEKGITIRWIAESKLPKNIFCDGYRLKQILINLVGNAVKFTDEGSVSIVSRVETASEDNHDLVIEVRDTGCGIPRDKLEIVFEEYEQVGNVRTGSGLGLSICKRLVELMGGSISVRSEIGLGSAFKVNIPLGSMDRYEMIYIDPITHDSRQFTEEPTIDRLPLRVLVAEDTRAIQYVLQRLLSQLVDEVEIVSNGKEAVERTMEVECTEHPFDLVFMDIQMPVVNGTEATRQLRREKFTKPIIALTAGAMEPEREACMVAGCTHFLAKPIDLHELRRLLRVIYESKSNSMKSSGDAR